MKKQGTYYSDLLDDESGERFTVPTRFAGYALHDPLGRKIGEIERLFVNGHGEPEYIAVKIGFLWWRKSFLIPVESVTVDDMLRVIVLR